ncbi:response regulator transcription factor [Parvibaculum sp.]|uniref:response regulator n=1 Tax=Parvibaculum sp. TaxID=2024848 RepID=UPI001B239966|nr:response regulator transcription factor [Parvibaculum sp.]MBO6633900.1 response regulator transcription factor [Parvibaculum sp.]MBO6677911.1 response regulator transcription factor [Parvibaculum sp.]MBO6683385.1 response regulator transcription factor [Parvibaculum sp.]MBO6904609.1 response regulator transcription factor [Parvibaculum sp.]
MSDRRIEIALVDDHRMFLDGLTEVINSLDPAYRCTGFASPREAIATIEEGREYDLIVSDLVMEEMNGVAFILALHARRCTAPVLIVSGIDTLPPVEKVLRLGALGFVPKSAPAGLLGKAIRSALDGEVFLPPDLWTVLEENPKSPRVSDAGAAPGLDDELLGSRQIEVLRLMAEGYSNKRISEVLDISENTVKTHIKLIFKRLNVARRTACVSKARTIGLID